MALQFLELPCEVYMGKTVELLKKHQNTGDNAEAFLKYHEKSQKDLTEKKYLIVVKQTLQIIQQTVTDVKLLTPIYSSLAYWITQLKDKEQEEAIDIFYQHINALTAENNNFKLKLAALLFNSQPTITLFKRMIELSAQLKNTSLILSSIVNDIEAFLNQWRLSQIQQKELLLNILNIIASSNHAQEKIQITLYLINQMNYDNQEEVGGIFVQFLNANPSIQQIGKTIHSQGFQFLSQQKHLLAKYITNILDGNIDEFQKLVSSNTLDTKLNQKLGLKAVKLCKLNSISDTKVNFTYLELSKELRIPENEVEGWIIQAIQSKVVEARIDQSKNQVTILDNSSKNFTKAHWELLKQKLGVLNKKLSEAQNQ